MKVITAQFILFISIGLLIFVLIYRIAGKYDPITDFRITQLLNKADSVEALAVGNSHSCALDFSALGINGYRTALGGNDISEAVYQVKSLEPFLPNLKLVFFNISYFSFFSDNSSYPDYYSIFSKKEYNQLIENFPSVNTLIDTQQYLSYVIINTKNINSVTKNKLGPALDIIMENTSDRSQLRRDYYVSIPSGKWIDGDFKNYLESRISVIIRKDHWHEILRNIFKGNELNNASSLNSYYGIDMYGQPFDSLRNSFKTSDSLNTLSKYFIAPRYLCDRKIVLENNGNVVKYNLKTLCSLIEYLDNHNIRIVFYTAPVYKSFTEYFDKSAIQMMKEKMFFLVKNYKVKYYDFSDDTTFAANNKFFYNSDHLNKSGAAEFSKYFRKILTSSDMFLSIN